MEKFSTVTEGTTNCHICGEELRFIAAIGNVNKNTLKVSQKANENHMLVNAVAVSNTVLQNGDKEVEFAFEEKCNNCGIINRHVFRMIFTQRQILTYK